MITQIAIIGLSGYLLIQSFFQLSESVFRPQQGEGWEMYFQVEKLVEQARYDQAASQLLFIGDKYGATDKDLLKAVKSQLAYVYYRKKDNESMFRVVKNIVATYPDEEVGKVGLFFIGEYYFNQQKYDYAIASYEMFLSKAPNSDFVPQAYYNIARSYYEQKNLDEAIARVQKMEKLFSRSALMPDVKNFAIGLYLELKRPEDAVRKANEIADSPDIFAVSEAWHSIAEYYFNERNYPLAAEYYARVKPKKEMLEKIAAKAAAQKAARAENRKRVTEGSRAIYDRSPQQSWWQTFDYEILYNEVKDRKDLYPSALLNMAQCAYEMKNKALAQKYIAEYKSRYPDEKELMGEYVRISVLVQGDVDAKDVADEGLLFTLLESWYGADDYARIIAREKSGFWKFSDPVRREKALFMIAEAHFLAGTEFYAEAAAVYERFLREYPTSQFVVKAKYNLATCYNDLKQMDKAVAAFEAFYREYPNEKRYVEIILPQLAEIYRAQKNAPQAIRWYREFIARFPEDKRVPRARYTIANLLYEGKRYDDAIAEFTTIITEYPDDETAPYAFYYLGMCYKEQDKFAEMVDALQRVVSKYPDNEVAPNALFWTAWNFQRQNKFVEAADAYSLLVAKYPKSKVAIDGRFNLADALFNTGRYQESLNVYVQVFENAVALNLDSAGVYAALDKIVRNYEKLGRSDAELEQFFRSVVSKYSGTPVLAMPASFKLAEYFYKKKDPERAYQALAVVESRLSGYSLTAEESYLVADVYFNTQRYQEAYGYYRRVVQQFPSHSLVPTSVWGMAECYLKLGAQGLNLSREVKAAIAPRINRFKDNEKVMHAYGKSSYLTKDYATAIQWLRPVTPPPGEEGAEVVYMLADSYYQTSDFQNALSYFARIVLVYTNYETWMVKAFLRAGMCNENLGQTDKAKQMYQELVSKYPNSEEAAAARDRLAKLN